MSILALGAALAKSSRPLVYGGGLLGLMGIVSQAVIDNGGHVTGISPYAMVSQGGTNREMAGVDVDKVSNREPPVHPNRTSIIVNSMHERKLEMASRADGGFVSLPGGYGTLEEVSSLGVADLAMADIVPQLLEVTTWAQLAMLEKRMCLTVSSPVFY